MGSGLEWMTLAASAVNAVGQFSRGNQANDMGEWQRAQAFADANAEREAGQVRAGLIRKQGEREKKAARAAIAGSGVDVGTGTPLKIEGQLAYNTEQDAQQEILYGTRKGARLEQEGELAAMAGRNRQSAAYQGGVGSLLSGGASIAQGWRYRAAPQVSEMVPGQFSLGNPAYG